MTLQVLLVRSFVNSWQRTFWFRSAELHGNIITTPHRDLADAIQRMYLPLLRAQMPDVEVRYVPAKPIDPLSAILKPHAPIMPQRAKATQRDLL